MLLHSRHIMLSGKISSGVEKTFRRLFANYNIQDDNDLLRASDICILIITVMKGSSPDYPGLSCKDIRDITNSNRNGEYWIDPEGQGNPFKVYCDMTTDGGKFKKNIPTLFPRRPLHLGGVLEVRVRVWERFECRLGNAFQPFQPFQRFQPFQPFQRILSLVGPGLAFILAKIRNPFFSVLAILVIILSHMNFSFNHRAASNQGSSWDFRQLMRKGTREGSTVFALPMILCPSPPKIPRSAWVRGRPSGVRNDLHPLTQ